MELVGSNFRTVHALTLGDAFEFQGIRFDMDAIFAPIVGATPANQV